jgi:hypothetical protein
MNYQHWIAHFRANRLNRLEPNWQAPFTLDEKQRRALALSLAEYQLGDGGGPCQLIARDAERYRAQADDIRTVVDLWFDEEREHSRLLGGAVRRLRGEFVTSTFAFRAFNACRCALGVQFEMLVLLIVEIVSTGYYRVIRRNCGDAAIDAMCRLILRDEVGHIRFHRDRLAAWYPQGARLFWRWRFHALGLACAAFLWFGHGRWLRAIGVTRAEFFLHIRAELRRFLESLAATERGCLSANSKYPAPARSSFPAAT